MDRPDVRAYLAAVRAELGDLRADERDELLLDVEASIVDAAEESDAPIAARLGSPGDFAAELRAAAGLAPEVTARRQLRLRELWESEQGAALRKIVAELAPIWWVTRAYVVIWALAWIASPDQTSRAPAVGRLASGETVLALGIAAAAASVALGLWQRRHHRAARVALVTNLALALAAVPAAVGLVNWLQDSEDSATPYFVDAPPTPGLARDGTPVENIYPYSRDGRLLLDVLLYDQLGRPLDVRADDADPARRVLRTKAGDGLFNSFPIRFVEQGTSRVVRPGAAPRITWSPIVTPALRRPATSP
jgi:hypothetical protein